MYRRYARQMVEWNHRLAPGRDPDPFRACLFSSALYTVNLLCLSLVIGVPPSADPFSTKLRIFLVMGAIGAANWYVFRQVRVTPRSVRWSDSVPSIGDYPAVYAHLAITMTLAAALLFQYGTRSAA